jgi:hypothetical protein
MLKPDTETRWLLSLEGRKRALFLAILSHELTVGGREAYRAGTELLDKPGLLRSVNEIQHRVTACLRGELLDSGKMDFVEALGRIVLEQSDHDLSELTASAWSRGRRALEQLASFE